MTDSPIAVDLVEKTVRLYYQFDGMDQSRDIRALDIGKGQPFWKLENCHTNWRGEIERDPAIRKRLGSGDRRVQRTKFYERDAAMIVEEDGDGVHLRSGRGFLKEKQYPVGTSVSLTNFDNQLHLMAREHSMLRFDGSSLVQSAATIKPAFGTPITERLAVAGMSTYPREVHVSAVGNSDIMPLNNSFSSTNVLRPATINVARLIDSADSITGLGSFAVDRLAILTQDQAIVYRMGVSVDDWNIDNTANVQLGCVAANTIQRVGQDLFFCSRQGVHSLSRNEDNGLTIRPLTLSDKIEDLYQSMIREIVDVDLMSAIYDQENYDYHIFFPTKNADASMVMTVNTRLGYENLRWSTRTTNLMRCGDVLGGQFIVGARNGLYNVQDRVFFSALNDEEQPEERGQMVIETPILWHGDIIKEKRVSGLVIQASGTAQITVEVYNDTDILLATFSERIEAIDNAPAFSGKTLAEEYKLPLNAIYRGVRLVIKTEDDGDCNIVAIGFDIVEEEIPV